MRNVPELRFDGFDEEWEEKEFGKAIERKSKSSSNNSLPRVEYEDIIPEIGKLNKDINSKSSIKKGIYFERDDVLFGKLRPYLKNYLNPQFEGIAVGDFWILNNKSGDNSFLFYYIQIPQFQYIANTSIGTKMPRSDWNLVSGSKFIYPSNNEQEKIGSLFRKIDDLIEIQEGKVSKMEDFKKSMLQKMFPKKDELVPEFRFDGFDGDWEKVKIKEIYRKAGSGGTPKSSISDFYNGDIPFLSISDITNSNGKIRNTEKNITKLGLDNSSARLVPAGSISLAMYASVGKVAKIEIELATSQAFFNMIPSEYYDTEFLYQTFKKMELFNQWRSEITTGTQPNLNANIINNFKLEIPSLEEQVKIGRFFKILDTQIENEEKLLESYKMMKKYLLQKMFV